MDEPETTERRPRVGESGAPVGSVLSIVLAVVAVVIGFVILRQINDDSGTADGSGGGNEGVLQPGDNGDGGNETGSTQPDGSTTTTAPQNQNVFKGAPVVVVNSNQQGGSAGDMTEKLADVGFTTGDPATGVGNQEMLQKSRLFINTNNNKARAVAETINRSFDVQIQIQETDGVEVLTVNGQRETINGPVILMMGTDLTDQNPTKP